jgi:GH3 auxin-responsive promoter
MRLFGENSARPSQPPAAPAQGCGCDSHGACDVAREVFALADPRQIDEAMAYAARIVGATVGEFIAAPGLRETGSLPSIDVALEFLVPPPAPEKFAVELDRALIRRSLEYSAARRTEQVAAMRVTFLPPGTFHQWRSAWRINPRQHRNPRWTIDRQDLESVIRQGQTGWRELLPNT